MIARRDMLGLLALAAPASCANPPPPRAPTQRVRGLDPEGEEILRAASLAPSRHNTQPWRVLVSDPRRFTVTIDDARAVPGVDPDGRERELALGAFLENAARAARALGRDATIELRDDGAAEMRLSPGTAHGSLAALESRTTLTAPFGTSDLSSEELRGLGVGENEVVYLSRSSADGRALVEATREGAIRQVARDATQRELAAWIRWKSEDAAERRDGYTLASLGITGLAAFYVSHFMGPEAALKEDFRARMRTGTDALLAAAAGFLVFRGAGTTRRHRIEVGRLFQRSFLAARALGVGFHPMSQAVEEHLLTADADHPVELVVRVGHVDSYPAPTTPRRPVAWFTAQELS